MCLTTGRWSSVHSFEILPLYNFVILVFYPAFPPGAQGSVIALCPQFFLTTVQGTLG